MLHSFDNDKTYSKARGKPILACFAALIMLSAVSGCAVTSAGVKKGDERNFVRSVNDVSAERVIKARMKRAHDFTLKGIDVEVAQGVALLSGNVPRQEDRIEAARIAWSAQNIDQIGNEIHVNGRQGLVRNTKDGVLEKSVRTRLTVDKYVKARNFNVETHDGIVYLLGVARDERELDRAARIAATTRGTREVITYVRVANGGRPQNLAANPHLNTQQNTQRDLPSFVTQAPQLQDFQQAPAPINGQSLNAPIPFNPPSSLPQNLPQAPNIPQNLPQAPSVASGIDRSQPFYVDPDTGEEIPVRFDANGNLVPRITR